ncbi:hypothetical protein H2O64_04770 [Kordia sp. YSTF-M3]|uniref:DUF2141 domain-containing protein n=1 Tax=Kordia aestuariivivens TaxID=2759037 RepID=A0ABR7Q5Y4_9FLAO|nr:hypothetical protein [Kordia aestuariivivens]MBC8753972.1 hypothetical protein [Kordia aestuariivivens]
MNDRKLKYVGVNLTLASRAKSSQEPKELTKGKCIGVTFFVYGDLPPQNINLSIEDTQGNPILEAVDVRDFEKGNTGGLQAYKQVNFNTNGKVYINLFSPQDAATTVNGHFLFVIDTNGYE